MLFQRISRKSPEKVFGIFQNVDAAAMADGEVAVLNITATPTVPGSEAKKSAGAAPLNILGVVAGAIAINDFGTIQIYGIHSNVKTTAAALAAGATITGDAAAAAVAGATADDPSARLGFCVVVGASNRAQCFIKCMG